MRFRSLSYKKHCHLVAVLFARTLFMGLIPAVAHAQLTGPLQVRRGTVAAMPALRPGEPYFATDTGEWWVGTNNTTGGNLVAVARPKVTGSANQTLRFSGTNTLSATSLITIDSSKAYVGTDTITLDPAAKTINVKDAAPSGEHYLISGEVNFGRKFGLYAQASGNEGGFKADSEFTLKGGRISVITGTGSSIAQGFFARGTNDAFWIHSNQQRILLNADSYHRIYIRGGITPETTGATTLNLSALSGQTSKVLAVRADAGAGSDAEAATVLASIDAAGVAQAAGFLGPYLSTSTSQLLLTQTGDAYGATSLIIRNRSGQAGAVIAPIASGAAVADLVYLIPDGTGGTGALQRNVRFEGRSAKQFLSGSTPEFQLGQIASGDVDPFLAASETGLLLRGAAWIRPGSGGYKSSDGTAGGTTTTGGLTFKNGLYTGGAAAGSGGVTSLNGLSGTITLVDTNTGDPLDADTISHSILLSFASVDHTHTAADITSGIIATARLGTGTPSSANYLRGDGTWTAVGGGGGSASPVIQRKTATYQILTTDDWVIADNATGTAIIMRLPSGAADGKQIRITRAYRSGGGAVTVGLPSPSYGAVLMSSAGETTTASLANGETSTWQYDATGAADADPLTPRWIRVS